MGIMIGVSEEHWKRLGSKEPGINKVYCSPIVVQASGLPYTLQARTPAPQELTKLFLPRSINHVETIAHLLAASAAC